MFSKSIHLSANFRLSLFFFCCVVVHSVNVPHFLYPFFRRGAFRLFLGSGYDKECCYEQSWAHVLVVQLSILSLGIYPKLVLLCLEEDYFLIFREITILISKAAVPFCTSTSNGRVFLLPYILSSRNCHQCFDLGHFYRCKMEYQNRFDLHFIDG